MAFIIKVGERDPENQFENRIKSGDLDSFQSFVVDDFERVTLPLCSCLHIDKHLVLNLVVSEVPLSSKFCESIQKYKVSWTLCYSSCQHIF